MYRSGEVSRAGVVKAESQVVFFEQSLLAVRIGRPNGPFSSYAWR